MVNMLEKYSNNLEHVVEERTKLLIEEKKKTDDLIYRMLPRWRKYYAKIYDICAEKQKNIMLNIARSRFVFINTSNLRT